MQSIGDRSLDCRHAYLQSCCHPWNSWVFNWYVSACASSGHALGMAMDEIRLGRQKRMLVVGAEDCNFESIVPFCGMRALSLETDPNLASRPFDRKRNGFVGTGGSVCLILETESEGLRRGVEPYAKIIGWGQASDGHNWQFPPRVED